jgi:hypothetical protein
MLLLPFRLFVYEKGLLKDPFVRLKFFRRLLEPKVARGQLLVGQ